MIPQSLDLVFVLLYFFFYFSFFVDIVLLYFKPTTVYHLKSWFDFCVFYFFVSIHLYTQNVVEQFQFEVRKIWEIKLEEK